MHTDEGTNQRTLLTFMHMDRGYNQRQRRTMWTGDGSPGKLKWSVYPTPPRGGEWVDDLKRGNP
jgi:hypothetical protein